ncbi:hypothetical protein PV797_19700 [Clostridiaceae bacterium M8S5]|nr:hypothetical protein PV797_19700 [Clostridiaceae bacterium M8S5]
MNNYEVVEEMVVERGCHDTLGRGTGVTTEITVPTTSIKTGVTWSF